VQYYRSNIPSPGLFWFRQKNGHNFEELKTFAEENKAGLVHGFTCVKTGGLITSFKHLKSTALISHPDIAQIVLREEDVFQKDPAGFGDFGPLLKQGLVNLNHENWRELKDVLAPAFHFEFIKKMVPIFTSKSEALFDNWLAKVDKEVHVKPEMQHFTMDALGLAAFNLDFNAVNGGSHEYMDSYQTIVSPPSVQKTEANITKAQEHLTKMTRDIIATKSASNQDGAGVDERDFLDRLIAGGVSERKTIDNVFLMFIAGHETTAHALEWALYFLAAHPEMQKRAREEVDEVFQGKLPDADSVKGLVYVDMFIKEVLRHRPPVASLITRVATQDAYVGDYLVPKGTSIGLSIYTIHHLKEFWTEPEKFDPLRFTSENSVGRHPFAYMPFSLGRRNCIGNNFSILEQKIFLSMLLQRFTIEKSEKCNAQEWPTWAVCWPFNIVINAVPREKYFQRAGKSA